MRYRRMPIEVESPEQLGYSTIRNNLAESSFSDMSLAAYGIEADFTHEVLPYGDHRGAERLREAVAADSDVLAATDILVTAGAVSALFVVASSLLAEGTHVLVCAPNYATNLETPRAIGADIETIDLRFDQDWRLDLDVVASRVRSDTKLVSVTYPHNPTGAMITRSELDELVAIVEGHEAAVLLVDETYRELAYGEPLPIAASLSPRVVSVSSMSKTYGLPGLRVGWLISRDRTLMETFLAAKEQIFITGAVVDEELAARVLERRPEALRHVRAKTQSQLAIVRDWIGDSETFEWVEPQAGVVCFPRVRPELDVDVAAFYRILLKEFGTYVGPGWWFDEDPRHFRLGFAWPTEDELRAGLRALTDAAARATRDAGDG